MEWLNITYNNPTMQRQVDLRCGKPFGVWDMIRRGGTGTPRMALVEASDGLMAPFDRSEDLRFCSIEVRQQGILIRCRSRLETMGLPLANVEMRELSLNAPGNESFGVLQLRTISNVLVVLHVQREHWGTVSKMLRKAFPDGRFKTLASTLYKV
jgi:hypothetical protein